MKTDKIANKSAVIIKGKENPLNSTDKQCESFTKSNTILMSVKAMAKSATNPI